LLGTSDISPACLHRRLLDYCSNALDISGSARVRQGLLTKRPGRLDLLVVNFFGKPYVAQPKYEHPAVQIGFGGLVSKTRLGQKAKIGHRV
jgi:hypothetical protein